MNTILNEAFTTASCKPALCSLDLAKFLILSQSKIGRQISVTTTARKCGFLPMGVDSKMSQGTLRRYQILASCVGTGTVTLLGEWEYEPVTLSEAMYILHEALEFV